MNFDAGDGDRRETKILFVPQDQFPPFRPAAKAIFADELPRRGYRIDWLIQASKEAVGAGPRPFGGGTVYLAATDDGTSRHRRLRKYWLNFRNDLQIFRLLKSGNYDAVQVKDKYVTALLAIVVCRLRGIPMFYWLAYPHAEASLYAAHQRMARYPLFYRARGGLQHWLLYRVILPAAAHVFVQSEQMRDDIVRHGIAREKMTPIPGSVNLLEMRPVRAAQKPPHERWVVYLGTLIRERQLDLLVRAFRDVAERMPEARLILVGAGEMADDEALLRAEAEKAGVTGKLLITGWLPMAEAWAYAKAADVCVSPIAPVPILACGSPTKLIEYMALGKAVVANQHPEQSVVVRESGGGLLCEWSEAAFARAIVHLLEHPDEARARGIAGSAYVEAHRTHTRMTDVVDGVYRSSLAEPALGLIGARE